MTKKKGSGHSPAANPEMAAALRGLRTSNAAGVHADRRTRRRRTRSAAANYAVREQREDR